ncbi:MAG: carbon starvation protein A [Planctomycetia bacterium]|jgi:carbon starvation protein|nr:carbon starvation protein A [Planctomycetia bacterium]
MTVLLLVALAAATLTLGYCIYGRWLASRLFQLDPTATMPSAALQDDRDFVPTPPAIVFGHHFTSIAGTGPIVGPALAIMWGWGPALVWVLLGSILIGGMHDMAVLVVSLRNRGMTIGEIAGRLLNPRVRLLFLVLLLFALWVVLAIFGWVIASVFVQFPEAILPVFLQIPIAVAIGLRVHRQGKNLLGPSLAALAAMYATVWLGAGCPGTSWTGGPLGQLIQGINGTVAGWPIWLWVAILLAYCYVASVLPVWILLQPRDYINSLQLISSLGLIVVGLLVTATVGPATIATGTPAPALEMFAPLLELHPKNAPPVVPFLFVTIACGAVSGFHCLVSSGTSSKQLRCETDARAVGYGSMLLEAFLAVIVIVAVGAGIGLGWPQEYPGQTGTELWQTLYADWRGVTGGKAIAAFVVGSGNLLESLGIDAVMARALVGVLVASFAGTTLDTATRLQRYVVQELAGTLLGKLQGRTAAGRSTNPLALPLTWLTTPHGATLFAVGTAFLLALLPAPGKDWSVANLGTGGLILWPLFGATNQLLAGLSLLVISFYLRRRGLPTFVATLPMVLMLVMPAWALCINISRWIDGGSLALVAVAVVMLAVEAWMAVEGMLLWGRVQGVMEEPLPPLLVRCQDIAHDQA